MKTRKYLVVICLFALFTLVLAACSSNANYGMTDPDTSGYHTGEVTGGEYSPLPTDSYMTVDGLLDETVWQQKNELIFTDQEARISVKTVMGDLGAYIGLEVKDKYIYYNPIRDMWQNASVELYLDRDDSTVKSRQSLQIRMDVMGKIETYMGISDGSYSWSYTHRPVYGEVKVYGEINSGNSEKFVAEIFVSWEALGYDVSDEVFTAPGGIKLWPAYCRSSGPQSTDGRAAWCVNGVGGNMEKPSMYFPFNENGYAQFDSGSAVMGDAPGGWAKTPGWTLGAGEAVSSAGNEQFISFRELNADEYMITAKIRLDSAALGSDTRVAGLIAANGAGGTVAYIINGANGLNGKLMETAENLSGKSFSSAVNLGAVADAALDVRITAVKISGIILVFIGDENAARFGGTLVLVKEAPNLSGAATAGFYTDMSAASFTDFAYSTNSGEIAEVAGDVLSYLNVSEADNGYLSGYSAIYKRGDTAKIFITTDEGYKLSSIKVNGTEKISAVSDGALSIIMDAAQVSVVPVFTALEGELKTVSGSVTLGQGMYMTLVDINLYGITEKGISQIIIPNSSGAYSARLPAGDYRIEYSYNFGFKTVETFTVEAGNITLPGVTLASSPVLQDLGGWKSENGVITGLSDQHRWFADATATGGFVAETKVKSLTAQHDWHHGGIAIKTSGGDWRLCLVRGTGDGGTLNINLVHQSSPWYRVAYSTGKTWNKGGISNYDSSKAAEYHVKLIYDGSRTYYIVLDGTLIYKFDKDTSYTNNGGTHNAQAIEAFFGAGNKTIGLFNQDGTCEFRDYRFSFASNVVESEIAVLYRSVQVELNESEWGGLTFGTASVSPGTVLLGGSSVLTVTPESGYTIDSVMIGAVNMTGFLTPNGHGGFTYTVDGITASTLIKVNLKENVATMVEVTGTYSYAEGLYGTGDTVTVSSGMYTGTASGGTFTISLPDDPLAIDNYTLTFTSTRFKNITLSVNVDGETSKAAGNAQFTAIKVNGSWTDNEGTLTGTSDSSVWLAGASTTGGFVAEVTVNMTAATGDRKAGGIVVKVGDEEWRIVPLTEGGGAISLIHPGEPWFRIHYSFSSLGLSGEIFNVGNTVVYRLIYDGAGKYYLTLNNTLLFTLSSATSGGKEGWIDWVDDGIANSLKTAFYATGATRSIGLFNQDGAYTFSNYFYTFDASAVTAAINDLNRSVSVELNESEWGGLTFGTASVSPGTVLLGGSSVLTITLEDGYTFDSVIIVGGADITNLLVPEGNGVFTYTISKIKLDTIVQVALKVQEATMVEVTGTYSYAEGLYGTGDTVTVSSGIYTGTASSGTFTIALPDDPLATDNYTLTFTSTRFKNVTLSVNVDGETSKAAGDTQFTAIKITNLYNDKLWTDDNGILTGKSDSAVGFIGADTDGVFMAEVTATLLSGAGDQIAASIAVNMADGHRWRLYYVAGSNSVTLVHQDGPGGWFRKNYTLSSAVEYTIGTPINIKMIYNGVDTYYLIIDTEVITVTATDMYTGNEGQDALIDGFFGAGTRSIGLVNQDGVFTFENYNYTFDATAVANAIAALTEED